MSYTKSDSERATYLPKKESLTSFSPDHTALLVIDPVNDFLSEGGAGWDLTSKTIKMNDVVSNIKKAIEGARLRDIPILFGPMAYTEKDYEDEQLQRRSGINRLMFERKMFLADSWGADFHPDLKPRANDIVLEPHKSCDVFTTDLPKHLKRMNITHLVIAGMSANLCCESTGRHAMEDGYDVTFLSNAIGASSIPEYEASIRFNYPLISNAVITVDEFLTAVDTFLEGDIDVEPGDTIKGSDNGEIGRIEKIEQTNDETMGFAFVPRGLIFATDTYVPLDAIVKRSGPTVYINIPKSIIGEMGWEVPPSKNRHREKVGPSESDVKELYHSRSPSGFKEPETVKS